MKRILSYLLTATLLCAICLIPQPAQAAGLNSHISVTGFDKKTDYTRLIQLALEDGGPYALQVGAIYEQQRNLKIQGLKLDLKQTDYFQQYTTAKEIKAAFAADERKYTDEELDLLAHIIYAEAGSSWIPDQVQRLVGSVVLNRVNSSRFPNTIHEVVYQPGQYAPTWDGSIHKTPDARTVANAKYLLEHGSICPGNVTGQSNFISGSGIYTTYYDSILGTTTYFCFT